jgi:ribosomal protein L29
MDINGKTKNELEAILLEKRESLRKFRFDIAGSKVKNVKEGKNLRKEIARILTEINK